MSTQAQAYIMGTARGNAVYLEEEFPMSNPHDSGAFRAVAHTGPGFRRAGASQRQREPLKR